MKHLEYISEQNGHLYSRFAFLVERDTKQKKTQKINYIASLFGGDHAMNNSNRDGEGVARGSGRRQVAILRRVDLLRWKVL